MMESGISCDGMLSILGSSLCAAGQMLGPKSLGCQWIVFELKTGERFRIDKKMIRF
jgi:hypothetical protein